MKKINSLKIIYSLLILSFFLLQKIVIKISGFELSVSIIIELVFILISILKNKIKLNTSKFLLYLSMVAISSLSFLLNTNSKITSLAYFIAIYIFLIFDYNFSCDEVNYYKKLIYFILVFTAFIGIFQFVMQIIGFDYFDIFDTLPNGIKLSGFNNYYPIWYGSNIMKSNGWIYLEPSFFSQFMVFGLMLSFENKNRIKKWLYVILFCFALIVSFSGTGIILLLIMIIPIFFKLNFKDKCICFISMLTIIFIFLRSDYSDSILNRITEFERSNSSGAIRFINPVKEIFSNTNAKYFLIGHGSGTCDLLLDSQSNFSTITKPLYEYGLIFSILYLVFCNIIFFKKGFNNFNFCLICMFLFLSGSFLQPMVIFTIMVFVNFDIGYEIKSKL